jgi:putative Mn2+ efflux pump MntP
MSLIELLIIAVGLAADAFAMAICSGVAIEELKIKDCLKVALYFGIFQGGMTLIGYELGHSISSILIHINYLIGFILLSVLGIKMIIESRKNEDIKVESSLSHKILIPLAFATSVDALAVGITFNLIAVSIPLASFLIFFITLILSILGVILGYKIGDKLQKKAELIGGIILIIMSINILLRNWNITFF